MDIESTAEYLSIPTHSVRLALAYYEAYPEDTDARLRRMEEVEENPYLLHSNVRIINVSDLESEASSGRAPVVADRGSAA